MPKASTPPPAQPQQSGSAGPVQVMVPGRWGDVQDMPIMFCNQIAIQVVQESAILTFGYAMPPLLTGTPEQQQAQVEEQGGLAVQPLARFTVPFSTLIQWLPALQALAAQAQNAIAAARVVDKPAEGQSE